VDLYICSTVRHLLLSLCRASKLQQEQHEILLFTDYQGISLDDWDFHGLPKNIHVHEMSRQNFKQLITSSARGRLSYQLALRTLSTPEWLQKPILDALAVSVPELAGQLNAGSDFNLWLFNERNKMSRLFRLLTNKYSIMEDGESSYRRFQIPLRKKISRFLRGKSTSYRTHGDDPRCKEIWVNYPDRLPPLTKAKGQLINFLEGPKVIKTITDVLHDNALPKTSARSIILATQPLDGMAKIPVSDKQGIFDTVVTYLEEQGFEVLLKLHPAEDPADYEFLKDRTLPTPTKVPIEGLVLAASEAPTILTISSAAGLGFERFFKRIKLIEYDDIQTLRKWVNHPEDLTACLKRNITTD
jgi:hypothetical protein